MSPFRRYANLLRLRQRVADATKGHEDMKAHGGDEGTRRRLLVCSYSNGSRAGDTSTQILSLFMKVVSTTIRQTSTRTLSGSERNCESCIPKAAYLMQLASHRIVLPLLILSTFDMKTI